MTTARTENMREWKETAANINSMDQDGREALGSHLLAKYGNQMMSTLRDRVQGLAWGMEIDHSAIQLLEQIGVTL